MPNQQNTYQANPNQLAPLSQTSASDYFNLKQVQSAKVQGNSSQGASLRASSHSHL